MKNYNKKQNIKWKTIKIACYILFYLITLVVTLVYKVNLIAVFILILTTILMLIADMAEEKEKNFYKGESGELQIERELKTISGIVVYRDVFLGKDNQWNIDFVIATLGGIYVLEVKNYDGRITAYGDLWYQTINSKRLTIPSFSKQAKSNAFELRTYLVKQNPNLNKLFFNPVVVLVQTYNKDDIKVNDGRTLVISPMELFNLVSKKSNIDTKLIEAAIIELNKL